MFSFNSSRVDSDDSNQAVFNTIANTINSEVETSDEFLNSELSPPFYLIHFSNV